MFPFLLLWGSILFFIGSKTAQNNAQPTTTYKVGVDHQGRTKSIVKEVPLWK